MIELNKYRLEGTPVNVDGVSSIYVWGDIHGDISKQEDLKQILDGLRDAVEGDATKIELEQLKQWVIDQHYLTEHQDISMKADKIDTYTKEDVDDKLSGVDSEIFVITGMIMDKQDMLVSGSNIKTINNQSILGSGDIHIEGTGGISEDKAREIIEGYNYTTMTAVENKHYLTQVPAGYATESWVESKGYLTQHQSLAGYATENWVEGKGYVVGTSLSNVATSGNYNDLSNKPKLNGITLEGDVKVDFGTMKKSIVATLPTENIDENTIYLVIKETQEEGDIYDEYMYINNKWELIGNTNTDLSDYYTKSEIDGKIPTLTSQLTNDSGFLTQHQSLAGYATESWVENKGYLTEHQDISGKADKTYVDGEISRVEGLIPNTVKPLVFTLDDGTEQTITFYIQ